MLSRLASMLKPPAEGNWQAGHIGLHGIWYEEWLGGKWQRLEIDGEMLVGQPHHVIYFGDENAWKQKPAWAQHRRDEIIDRIKSKFRIPDYEYDGEAILSEADKDILIRAAGGLSDTPCRWASCTSPALHGKQFCVTHCHPQSLWRQPTCPA
ncbi:hypothetical protein [Prosthecobacter sp.]|uniref:hypothetical protein n=1 Tax=Prosthecobacter sp. TaxID=1965333 RepID=UPI003782D46D